jgi:SM-20-related protein
LNNQPIDHADRVVGWSDQLAEKDYVVIDDFLTDAQYKQIRAFFLDKIAQDEFDKAGIGAQDQYQVRSTIRGDFVYWLDENNDEEMRPFFDQLNELMRLFNRYLMLSLSGFEFHLAHYPAGTFYKKHLDQFQNRSNRMLSLIIYLNEGWKPGDGGELRIFRENEEAILVEPVGKRAVIFRSDVVPHEVMMTYKSRYSLTGWMLYRPVGLGYL